MIPISGMHLGRMLNRAILLKTCLVFILLLIPFLLTGLTFSQASLIETTSFKDQHVDCINPVLTPGCFQYFDVTLNVDADRISIIAYNGEFLTDSDFLSV